MLVMLGGLCKHAGEEFTVHFSSVVFKHKYLLCLVMHFCLVQGPAQLSKTALGITSPYTARTLPACTISTFFILHMLHIQKVKKRNVLLVIERKTNNALHIKLCHVCFPWQGPKHHSYSDSSSASTEGGIN